MLRAIDRRRQKIHVTALRVWSTDDANQSEEVCAGEPVWFTVFGLDFDAGLEF